MCAGCTPTTLVGGAGIAKPVCWLLVASDHQMGHLRTPNHVSCSLPIPKAEEYNLKHSSVHLHKEVMYTVHGILTFIKRLTGVCLQSLHHCFITWTQPDTTSLLLGTLTDQARSKSELVAENALLRQQLISNHAGEIWACDFLQVTDLFFRSLFAFFISQEENPLSVQLRYSLL
jgi:hypothetical protein